MTTLADGTLVPGAAESFTVSEDGLRYVFNLRRAGRWSNGDPVTARDFVRGLEYAIDSSSDSPQAVLLAPIKGSGFHGNVGNERLGVHATNAHELVIELEYAAPFILSIFEYPVTYPRHEAADEQSHLSNGAYTVKEFRVNSYVLLEANKYYRNRDSLEFSQVRYLAISDERTELNIFRSGDLDLTSTVPNSMTRWIREELSESYLEIPKLGVYYLALNNEHEVLANKALRKSMVGLIDRNELVESVVRGGQLPTNRLVPSALFLDDGTEDMSIGEIDDESEAASILQDLGYSREKPLRLRLVYNNGDNHRQIAIYVGETWESQLPVDVELISQDFRVLLQTQKDPDSWEIVRSSWIADFPDPYNFLSIFESSSPNNIPKYRNTAFDDLLNRSLREANQSKRLALLRTAEQILLDDAPAAFLYFYVDRRLISRRIDLLGTNPMGVIRSEHIIRRKSEFN